jgi:hypothetical protein
MLSHDRSTNFGSFSSRLAATYVLDYSRAQFKDSPLIDALNTPDNPVDLRLRGSVSWDYRGFGLTGSVNFVNSYEDTISATHRSIGSWTTWDMQARYGATPSDPDRLFGLFVSLSAQNIFDSDPPFYNNPAGYGYDPSNAELMGRFVSVQLRKAW